MLRADEKGEGLIVAKGRQGEMRLLTPHGLKKPTNEPEADED